MKISLRAIVYLMIVILAASGIYLWSLGSGDRDVLDGIDPEGFDVEAVCTGVDGNLLLCNQGKDAYLFLDGTRVYRQKIKTEIKENGDEETKVSYKGASFEKLEDEIAENGEAHLHMWLTETGKVNAVMLIEKSFENNNASQGYLEGLDPASYTSSSVILKMDKKGMVLAPLGYTETDKDKFADLIHQYRFAGNVNFYTEKITITVDGEGNRQKNIQYGKTTYRDMKESFAKGMPAYIWLNSYGNISAVMTYTENIVLK